MPLIGTKVPNYTLLARFKRCDLDLDQTMPNVDSSELFLYTTIYVQVSCRLNHYFLSYRVHRQTDRQTHRQSTL